MANVQPEGGGAPPANPEEGYPVGLAGGASDAVSGLAIGAEQAVPSEEDRKGPPSTRASATWTALAIGLALLVVVLVFILENLQEVKVTFFGAHWRAPLAVDLLLAAVLGGLVVFMAGALRIVQLRRHVKRRRAQATAQLSPRQG